MNNIELDNIDDLETRSKVYQLCFDIDNDARIIADREAKFAWFYVSTIVSLGAICDLFFHNGFRKEVMEMGGGIGILMCFVFCPIWSIWYYLTKRKARDRYFKNQIKLDDMGYRYEEDCRQSRPKVSHLQFRGLAKKHILSRKNNVGL